MIDILAKHFNLIDPRTSDIPASLNLATNIDARLLVGFSTSRDTFDILPLISVWDIFSKIDSQWMKTREIQWNQNRAIAKKVFYWKSSLTLT